MKFCLLIPILGLLCNYATGTALYVPTDYPTIQEGIEAASEGDSVILEVGTYNECDIMMKYGIYLSGETGNPDDVTIDAPQNGSVIICEDFTGEAPTTVEALTITSSADSSVCYGIWCENCPNIIISNNIINGNGNTGIISFNSSVLIEDNRIYDNGHVSVGCYGDGSQAITIRNNIIHNNRNMYTGEGLGGGIYCSGVRLDLSDNLIYDNRSGLGGGLFAIGCRSAYASNNTIVNNVADDFGGGIVLVLGPDDSAFIENSILWANSVEEIYIIADSGAHLSIRYCDIMGGWDGEGNFDLDPQFCDTALGNFSIDVASPCAPDNNGSGLLIGAKDAVVCETDVADENSGTRPESNFLSQNCPNPFNPSTRINFGMARRGHVTISIYNMLGEKVAILTDEIKAPGHHSAVWDGKDRHGEQVASGVYFYSLRINDIVATKKMVFLK